MTASRWPVHLIPRRSPPFWMGLLICVASVATAMFVRGALLGFQNATGFSATLFPALIVATLYAGARWGWVTLGATTAIGLVSPTNFPSGMSEAGIIVQFVVSATVTVAVSATLRSTLLRLDEANAAQAEAQKALEITEARFRSLADSAPILMWVTRTDGRRQFANQTYVDFVGLPYEAAINYDWRKALHRDDAPRIREEQIAGEASRQAFVLEARFKRYDDEYRWIRSISQPRWGPDGEFQGFIGVGFDVTDAKRAEGDLKRINDILAERIDAALTERDAAEAALRRGQKLEAVGQLTGGVAHDFNNLLTVIIGALDLIQRHPADAARRERMIEAALGAARRGERLTQQLLAFARRQALKPEPVHVDDLLAEAEPLLHRAVGEAVRLTVAAGAKDAVTNVDASQLEAALMNLVVNARDATPAGGMVRVETLPVRLADGQIEELIAGDYLCIGVHDTGSGMDEATVARAFEPFFTTKEPGRGTGLGLSQVYGFARQSGGVATLDSAPGKGSSVCIYLPLTSAQTTAAPETAAPAVRRGPTLQVLLAEDDVDVGDVVEAMLGDLGHEVRRAGDADAALKVLKAGAVVDLLITDLIMPGDKSGVDLAREAVRMRPSLPVILSSGYTGETLSLADGAPWPLLRKPYGADDLAGAIADAMRKATEAA
jgi:PAS domain S-box-containing protein